MRVVVIVVVKEEEDNDDGDDDVSEKVVSHSFSFSEHTVSHNIVSLICVGRYVS